MTPLPDGNPRVPEHINNPPQNALLEFGSLVAMVGLVMAALTLLLVLLAGFLAPHIPFRWEAAAVSDLPVSAPWPQADAALNQLADDLMASMDPPPAIPVQVRLIDMQIPNAFATLGGHVLITRGLLDSVTSENGLAMVLAHEIGHIQHRDPIAVLSRSAVIGLLWAAVTGGENFAMQTLFGQSGGLTALRFNRDMERRADQYALDMLAAHYGHVQGADEFFLAMVAHQNLAHQDAGRWQALFQSHPLTRERIKALQQALPAQGEAERRPLPPALQKLTRPEDH
ncbi:M48 family metallopeptidase [Alcanivorax sp. JB21]|uniref:M48 family metallopeptidase n=1 Tax=Alcanivorax limicola TaxID=2874102 RepID=UPI001CBE5349|nr:M48 family metallopeptidase [Alcanivorax limicola]MBZ2189737.1 M48 family metallopeptidase [Alcanivorax limicola]